MNRCFTRRRLGATRILSSAAIFLGKGCAIAMLLIQIPTDRGRAQAATFDTISRIYAYGDSYSDSGASLEISNRAVEADIPGASLLPAAPALELYDAQGRWSNGPTAVEVLAKKLDVTLTNYSIGGAKSGSGNFFDWLNPFQDTGVFGQVEQFSADRKADSKAEGEVQPVDAKSLHFIFASANDFFEYLTEPDAPGTIDELAKQTVDNIVRSVSDLSTLGAQQFIVVNSSDLAALPGALEFDIVKASENFTRSVNTQLPTALSKLSSQLENTQIALYDHTAISDKIRANPSAYGLTNIDDPCQPVFPVEPACDRPDDYYFWDENHPTERVHQIIGEDMAQFIATDKSHQKSQSVPEPASTLGTLLLIGTFGAIVLSKNRVEQI